MAGEDRLALGPAALIKRSGVPRQRIRCADQQREHPYRPHRERDLRGNRPRATAARLPMVYGGLHGEEVCAHPDVMPSGLFVAGSAKAADRMRLRL